MTQSSSVHDSCEDAITAPIVSQCVSVCVMCFFRECVDEYVLEINGVHSIRPQFDLSAITFAPFCTLFIPQRMNLRVFYSWGWNRGHCGRKSLSFWHERILKLCWFLFFFFFVYIEILLILLFYLLLMLCLYSPAAERVCTHIAVCLWIRRAYACIYGLMFDICSVWASLLDIPSFPCSPQTKLNL